MAHVRRRRRRATGVEVAGQIAELSRRALKGNFRRIDRPSARVVLVDGGKEILAAFGDRLSQKAPTSWSGWA